MNRKLSIVMMVFLLLLVACSNTTPNSTESNRFKVDLIQVTDGDTIKVKVNGKEESVRFLLVDTPETNHPRLGKQPMGEEAKQFTENMLENAKVIELEKDVSERDKYGRFLAYVYADGKSVQEELLQNGLARVAYVYQPNVKYVDTYRKIQEEAQKKGVGIWKWENYAQEDGFKPEVIQKQQDDMKANEQKMVASKNSNVYHPAGCYVENQIKPENRIYFINEEEAIKSGRTRSKVKECWE